MYSLRFIAGCFCLSAYFQKPQKQRLRYLSHDVYYTAIQMEALQCYDCYFVGWLSHSVWFLFQQIQFFFTFFLRNINCHLVVVLPCIEVSISNSYNLTLRSDVLYSSAANSNTLTHTDTPHRFRVFIWREIQRPVQNDTCGCMSMWIDVNAWRIKIRKGIVRRCTNASLSLSLCVCVLCVCG